MPTIENGNQVKREKSLLKKRSHCLTYLSSIIMHNDFIHTHINIYISIHTRIYIYMYTYRYITLEASLIAWAVKNLSAMQETWVWSLDARSPGEENGYPLQYSCLGNPIDREAWGLQSMRSQKSWTRVRDWHWILYHINYALSFICPPGRVT